MAIRIRDVNGKTIALCAAKTEHQEGDFYLDDNIHHALSIKLHDDFVSEGLIQGKNLSIQSYLEGLVTGRLPEPRVEGEKDAGQYY